MTTPWERINEENRVYLPHGGWEDTNTAGNAGKTSRHYLTIDKVESRELAPPTARYKTTQPKFEESGGHDVGCFGGKSGAVDEQDLDGFDYGGDDKHIERQAMLNVLATQLADVYGEQPVIPQWARAETTTTPN